MNPKKVTLSDIMHEYLGRPASQEEAAERARESLSPKERELLRDLQKANIRKP